MPVKSLPLKSRTQPESALVKVWAEAVSGIPAARARAHRPSRAVLENPMRFSEELMPGAFSICLSPDVGRSFSRIQFKPFWRNRRGLFLSEFRFFRGKPATGLCLVALMPHCPKQRLGLAAMMRYGNDTEPKEEHGMRGIILTSLIATAIVLP